MVSHYSLSDSKFPPVSRTLLSILADLNNAIVWMVSFCPNIFKSPSPFTNPLEIVLRASIIIGIIITFVLQQFFSSLARSRYLSLFLFSVNFIVVCQDGKIHNLAGSLFLCLSLGLVVWLRLGDLFLYQNPREHFASHSPGQILGCAYTTCLYSQIWNSCTIPSGSPSSHVESYTLFALIIMEKW